MRDRSQRTGRQSGSEALLAQLGKRVRALRAAHGLSRRALSDASGVSPRYLAHLESGEGNVSIGILDRVARALGVSVVELLGHPAGRTGPGTERFARLFAAADAATRARALRILEAAAGPDGTPDPRQDRIALIGLRGAGKTTLGRAAADALGLPFVELNDEIEALSGMDAGELIALYGQEGYRRLEAEALDRVTERHPRLVLAVAGGIVEDESTYQRLLSRFHTIWLRTSPEEHMERVRAQGDERPMAGNPAAMEQLKSILRRREEVYARADATLDTSSRSVETSLAELLDLLARQGFVRAQAARAGPD